MVESLGKLAFEQLQKGNLIFYESDLSECGLDAAAASVYSGVFTQIFREEPGLYQDKVYCFIHLSVQEFLAALHVHVTFFSSGVNLLSPQQTFESPEAAFYRSAVNQALQSPNGHLDLFLRFLLGLSLPTNQSLLQGLLTQTGSGSLTNQETVKYIKEKLSEDLSAERSMNLFHCLNELNDRSLVEEVQRKISGHYSWAITSPAEWSALAFLLLSSDSDLEEFDLKKYKASEEALLRLMPLVKASSKALLSSCNLSQSSCGPLSSVLSSSSLTHLDLSNNDLQDSGVELLCSGLKSAPCRLETLRLSGCLVSERGGASLASALSSAPSHLRELDLSYNHPGPSAELLTALWDAPHCPLDSLRLDPAGERWMTPGLRKYFCELTLDPNTADTGHQLSDDNRRVRSLGHDWFPFHLESQPRVLCSTGLTGRCYWEVTWEVDPGLVLHQHLFLAEMSLPAETGVVLDVGVDISVGYRRSRQTKRRGRRFGDNDQSWSLRVSREGYSVHHNNRRTPLYSHRSFLSGRVGIYLDSEAGALSFFEVLSDGELSHLHTFNTTFTEPLFPGIRVNPGCSVSLCNVSSYHMRHHTLRGHRLRGHMLKSIFARRSLMDL